MAGRHILLFAPGREIVTTPGSFEVTRLEPPEKVVARQAPTAAAVAIGVVFATAAF